jgi:glutathione peroxidase
MQGMNMKVYDFKANNKYGDEISLSEYEGKVILIINSATQCGFTPQYDLLQDLYEKYGHEGLVILDFPCNQFGHQAPGTDEEIYSFCDANYGVKFPIFSKIEVNGENAHPLFKFLVSEKGFAGFDESHPIAPKLIPMLMAGDPEYMNKPSIKWNFTKFLIDRKGNVVERFEPTEDMFIVEDRIKGLL